MMAYANTFAGYYMMCTSAHTMEHTMGSFHDKLVHGADLKMSEAGITKDELKLYPKKVHEVLGGDITADPLALSDEDYLAIYEAAYK